MKSISGKMGRIAGDMVIVVVSQRYRCDFRNCGSEGFLGAEVGMEPAGSARPLLWLLLTLDLTPT